MQYKVLSTAALLLCCVALANAQCDLDPFATSDCGEDDGAACHELAFCEVACRRNESNPFSSDLVWSPQCFCMEGTWGDGNSCTTEAGSIRISFKIGGEWDHIVDANGRITDSFFLFSVTQDLKGLWTDRAGFVPDETSPIGDLAPTEFYEGSFTYAISGPPGSRYFTAIILFETLADANDQFASMHPQLMDGTLSVADGLFVIPPWENGTIPLHFGLGGAVGELTVEPRAYEHVTGTTDDPITILPTGMDVERVFFNHACLSSGCWVIDVVYTTGEDNFNVFYVPRSDNDDTLSYDEDYTGTRLLSTYAPANFPCGNDNYDASTSEAQGFIEQTVSACCIPSFIDWYRPVVGFQSETFGAAGDLDDLRSVCPASGTQDPPEISTRNMPGSFLAGVFAGMNLSYVEHTGTIDPYLGIYSARFHMDEIELRRYGGMLSGTVSVEHAIDTFVGLAEFSPTANGMQYIDMATKQVEIHLEKTSFFTVATHGVNDYTFLRYINLRLMQTFVGNHTMPLDDGERVNRDLRADYIQVTFSVGAKYAVKPWADIVPLDSVLIGYGDPDDAALVMSHACLDYDGAAWQSQFDAMVGQSCGPQSAMCRNPSSIPDNFMAFNVPAGMQWFPDPELVTDQTVFVSMVVQVVNTEALKGAAGSDPQAANITKTTLKAAIPVVSGGFNIFCDAITAAMDLADVASALWVVGTAQSQGEWEALQVVGGPSVTNSAKKRNNSTQIDSESVESAFVTLILQGNQSFFHAPGMARDQFGLELEDVVTLHIMEDPRPTNIGFELEDFSRQVYDLVNSPGDDMYDDDGSLRTEGYALNRAFDLEIDSVNGRASLVPSLALLSICPFGRQAVDPGDPFPELCYIRRDVTGRNFYPVRPGNDLPTAMEIPHCGDEACTAAALQAASSASAMGGSDLGDRVTFMGRIYGDNAFSENLALNYSHRLAQAYDLNNMENRGYWIHPGYEWLASELGGQNRFQLSSRLIIFALVGLNENRLADSSVQQTSPFPAPIRRRVLLQQEVRDSEGTSLSSVDFQFTSGPKQLLAQLAEVPEEQIVGFDVEMQLSQAQACMPQAALMTELKLLLGDAFRASASFVSQVSVVGLTVSLNGVACRRSAPLSRSLLATLSDATAKLRVLVVFSDAAPQLNMEDLLEETGMLSAQPDPDSILQPTEEQVSSPYVPPGEWGNSQGGVDSEGEGGGGGKMMMILVAVGAVVGALVLGALAVVMMRRAKSNEQAIEVIEAVSVNDLKVSLQREL